MKSIILGLLGIALVVTGAASAQEYPTQPIRIINGFAAGGSGDLISRLLAGPLEQRLGQPIIVESKPGASGIIAGETIANSAPDGHTLGIFFGAHAVQAAIRTSLPYDSVESFQPITNLVDVGLILSVRQDSPIKDVADLIARAKENPGTLTFGSAGNSTSSHLTGEVFRIATGADVRHVPYQGEAAAMVDLLRGDIAMTFGTTVVAGDRIKEGALRGLGISTPARWHGLPDVPAIGETVPGFAVTSWIGLMGPANMPPQVVERLNKEVREILEMPEIKERLEQMVGGTVHSMTPDEMKAMLVSEIDRWKKVVAEAGIPQQ